MLEPIQFVKLSGSGNDFICIDNRDGRLDGIVQSDAVSRLARALCRRGLSVGADGVIFAQDPGWVEQADVLARFFEPDGSEAQLCGNGVACLTYWVLSEGWTADSEVRLLTSAGIVRGKRMDGEYIRACIPEPEGLQRDLDLQADGRCWRCDFMVTGVPHVVTYVDDVEAVDVARLGPLFRRHQRFAPRGANANFVQVLGEGRIALRTFEFGVENETLACGTGSAAAAMLSAMRFAWPKKYLSGDQPVLVRARSGETMRVLFTRRDDGVFDTVCLDTVVRCIYRGTVCPERLAEAIAPGSPPPAAPGAAGR